MHQIVLYIGTGCTTNTGNKEEFELCPVKNMAYIHDKKLLQKMATGFPKFFNSTIFDSKT